MTAVDDLDLKITLDGDRVSLEIRDIPTESFAHALAWLGTAEADRQIAAGLRAETDRQMLEKEAEDRMAAEIDAALERMGYEVREP